MSDTKIVQFSPSEAPRPDASAAGRPARRFGRKRLRLILLLVIPLLAAAAGLGVYALGGGAISTDNAYVGAQKVLITPDISGKVAKISVREGQPVAAGDELLSIDPEPFRLALAQTRSKLAGARTDYNNLKSNLASLNHLVELAQRNVELKQHDVDRKSRLLSSATTSQADVETAGSALVTAQLQAQLTRQQRDNALNQLLGNPDLPLDQFPPHLQAKAAVEQAERDLDHTVLRAPIAGIATQVDNIQLGRFVTAGGPILSVVDDRHPWVDANPKETDITDLRVGQPVSIAIDSFPDHTFRGTVVSVSPGTGAQFSILPPQNASGNWVKVVQRVPVRIAFADGEETRRLRAGMSANVTIDTGTSRLPLTSARVTPAVTP